MRQDDFPITSVALPVGSRITQLYAHTNLADAYAIDLPPHASHDPEVLARFLFAHQAAWVASLMRLRDAVVAPLGIKTSKALRATTDPRGVARVGIFRIYETHGHEVILGEDDTHLDFRLSVLCQTRKVGLEEVACVVASTVVHCHNRIGRLYLLLIAPFHRMVVRSALRNAARNGWPVSVAAASTIG